MLQLSEAGEAAFGKPDPVTRYRPTFVFAGDYISQNQREFATAPVDGVKIVHKVRGSLRRADAAKIYELAYFSAGDTLDLGTNWGLSAYVAATALTDADKGFRVTSIDLEPKMSQRAGLKMKELEVGNAEFVTSDATSWVRDCGRKFGFAFIDHSHAYEHVHTVCLELGDALLPGATLAFHDFADYRNLDPANEEFRVLQAVRDGLDGRFQFLEISGCMGVFRFMP